MKTIFFSLLCAFCLLDTKVLAQSTPDPGLPGPFSVTKEIYNLGVVPLEMPSGLSYYSEFMGSVHYPAFLGGASHPLIVLLHGNHGTCYNVSDSSCGYIWPIPEGYKMLPNFEGYDYFAEHLASHGFIVISISGNAVNYDYRLDMKGRARLIQKHLDFWNRLNKTGAYPFGKKFVGRVDLERIGTMGHSRGGEGVLHHAEYNKSLGSPYNIKAVMSIAPTNSFKKLNRIPFLVIAPYCDGDVGLKSCLPPFDLVRYNDTADDASKYSILLMGANHNYFNTVWTPKSYFVCTKDDWTDADSFCNTSMPGNGRLDSLTQRAALKAYGAAFFRLHLLNDSAFAPILEVEDLKPPSSTGLNVNQVYVSFHAGKSKRLDINTLSSSVYLTSNNLWGLIKQSGLESYFLCTAGSFYPYCLSNNNYISFLSMRWFSDTAFYQNEIIPPFHDIRKYQSLSFRTCVQIDLGELGKSMDFKVSLIDSFGNISSTKVSQSSTALYYPPDKAKMVFNTVKIPLNKFSGIDFSKINYIRFSFDTPSRGAIGLADMAFVSAKSDCGNLEPRFTDSLGKLYQCSFFNKSTADIEDSLVYSWNFGDPASGSDNISDSGAPVHLFTDTGYYLVCMYVKAYKKSGAVCLDSFCKELHVEYESTAGDSYSNNHSEIRIIPNPANKYFSISGSKDGDNLELFSLTGQSLFKVVLNRQHIMIPSSLNEGMYIVVITSEGNKYFNKLLIKRD